MPALAASCEDWKTALTQCKYPTAYRHALVTPIPKVTPPRDIENDFRQISILPQMAKVLESLQLKVSALTHISQNWFNVTDNSKSIKNEDFRKALIRPCRSWNFT
jgi:hypothetical protein